MNKFIISISQLIISTSNATLEVPSLRPWSRPLMMMYNHIDAKYNLNKNENSNINQELFDFAKFDAGAKVNDLIINNASENIKSPRKTKTKFWSPTSVDNRDSSSWYCSLMKQHTIWSERWKVVTKTAWFLCCFKCHSQGAYKLEKFK